MNLNHLGVGFVAAAIVSFVLEAIIKKKNDTKGSEIITKLTTSVQQGKSTNNKTSSEDYSEATNLLNRLVKEFLKYDMGIRKLLQQEGIVNVKFKTVQLDVDEVIDLVSHGYSRYYDGDTANQVVLGSIIPGSLTQNLSTAIQCRKFLDNLYCLMLLLFSLTSMQLSTETINKVLTGLSVKDLNSTTFPKPEILKRSLKGESVSRSEFMDLANAAVFNFV